MNQFVPMTVAALAPASSSRVFNLQTDWNHSANVLPFGRSADTNGAGGTVEMVTARQTTTISRSAPVFDVSISYQSRRSALAFAVTDKTVK